MFVAQGIAYRFRIAVGEDSDHTGVVDCLWASSFNAPASMAGTSMAHGVERRVVSPMEVDSPSTVRACASEDGRVILIVKQHYRYTQKDIAKQIDYHEAACADIEAQMDGVESMLGSL